MDVHPSQNGAIVYAPWPYKLRIESAPCSKRFTNPFVAVDASAISESLLVGLVKNPTSLQPKSVQV